MSGLRGAADSSGDGRVTLGEAYADASAHTVESTAETTLGTQHPGHDLRLSGEGERVLSSLVGRDAALVVPAGFERALVVAHPSRTVVGELAGAGRLAVPAGRYAVTAWSSDHPERPWLAQADVTSGVERRLATSDFAPASLDVVAAKGGVDLGEGGTMPASTPAVTSPARSPPAGATLSQAATTIAPLSRNSSPTPTSAASNAARSSPRRTVAHLLLRFLSRDATSTSARTPTSSDGGPMPSAGSRFEEMSMGQLVAAARRAALFRQHQLGGELRVTARTVSRWENDHYVVPASLRAALVEAVGEAPDKLVAALARRLGVAPASAAPPTAAERAVRLDAVLFASAEALDVSPRRLRAALLDVLAEAARLGITVAETRGAVATRAQAHRRP